MSVRSVRLAGSGRNRSLRGLWGGCAVAAAALILQPAPASALVFIQGAQHTINFDGHIGTPSSGTVAGLTSSLTLSLVNAASGRFTFDYSLRNSSSLDSSVTSFGFASIPDVTGGRAISGAFDNLRVESGGILPVEYPGYRNIEVCLATGPLCSLSFFDGAQDGGPALRGRFELYASGTTLNLTDFAVRYTGINNYQMGVGVGEVVSSVPEPDQWVMLIVGFGIVGHTLRRQRRSLAAPALA